MRFKQSVESDADAQLMLQAAAGDKRAFAILFDRYQASVVRFAYRFVGEHAKAEELTQEIFLKLYRGASNYRPSAKFRTFLFRVASNHCLNEIRRPEHRRSAKCPPESLEAEKRVEPPGSPGERPDEVVAGKELEAAVQRALAAMSDRERAAFVMCRFEGMPYREIAVALSATELAIKSLIHRATLVVAREVRALDAGLIPARSHG